MYLLFIVNVNIVLRHHHCQINIIVIVIVNIIADARYNNDPHNNNNSSIQQSLTLSDNLAQPCSSPNHQSVKLPLVQFIIVSLL